MSLLKDTKKQRPKNSAKLPKLPIHQQIQNNEVIERMNRKIAFTKNQRHLGSTITYNQALSNTHKQFTVTGSKTLGGSKFKSVPEQIIFNHYELHRVYESEIKLINESMHIQRIKITPLSKKQFNIFNVSYPREDSGDIAPGMSVTITIRFKPANLGDLEQELIVICNGGTIRVPILAMRQRPGINWPKLIDCGHCWVGNNREQSLVIQNTGGEAEYYLVSPQHNLDISDENRPEKIEKGFFTIEPTVLRFQKQGKQRITVKFSPQSKGNFTQTIKFKSNQGEQQQIDIKLKGGAYNAQLILQKINGEVLKQQSLQNNLYINGTEVNKLSHAQITIQNLAVVDVDYFWHIESGNQKNSQGQKMIEISKQKGKLAASSEANFEISYLPQNRTPQNIRAELYLFNLPEKSLVNKSQMKKINGVEAIECLVVNIKTRPKQSAMLVYPLHKQIVSPIYRQVGVTQFFTIENSSQSRRHYKISLISTSQYCAASLLGGQQGALQPGQTRRVQFQYCITQLSMQQQRAYFLIEFDNSPGKIFSVGGYVKYPEITFNGTELFYGLCKTYTTTRKQLVLTNNQGSPLSFKVINPIKYYEQDFYDFYDFDQAQAEQYKRKRLTVYNKTTNEVVNDQTEYRIGAGENISLVFEYNTMGAEFVNEQISISTVNGQVTHIPLILHVQEIKCEMSRQEINLRHIYKGNVYNSNKFLSKELSIQNKTNIETTFEFQEFAETTCLIKIDPIKFTLPPKGKKRIDLLIQPVRTGEWVQEISWKYYDDFKLNPVNYPHLSQSLTFNPSSDSHSSNFIREQTLTLKGQIKGVQTKYYIKDESRVKRVRQKIQDMPTSVKHSTMSFKSSKTNFHEQQKLVYPYLEELNFYNCEINQVRQLEIIIENDSGMTIDYNIFAENYRTLEKHQPHLKNSNTLQDEEAFSSQMGRTFLQTRKLDKSQKVHLSNNKGISIMCDPPNGILHKKQSQKVVITMFNDTSGRFKDFLVVDIKDHEQKKFPIDIHVKGTPVLLSRNQLGINFNEEIPVMNLGSVLVGNGQVRKNIKVVNKGPKEVHLSWKTYPHNKRSNDQDIFKIQFGEAVPGTSDIVEVKWQAIEPQVDKGSVFMIEPRQKTLKGRQEVSFALIVNQLSQLAKYQNLLICEPELRDGDRKVKMQNLAVVVETECVQPILVMDKKHANHINKLELVATEHVNKQKQTVSDNHIRKLKLKNQQKVNLQFEVSIQSNNQQSEAFKIVSINTNSPGNVYDPNKTFLTGKKYTLTFDSIVQILVQLKANKKDSKDWPLEPKTRKDGAVILKYSNGHEQIIPLVGWLYRPWIQVQMPNNLLYSIENTMIDFGTIHVKNSKKLSLYLINPTKCDAKFTITYIKYQQSKKINFQKSLWTAEDYEDETITDSKECFFLNQDAGIALNNSIPVHYMPGTLALPSMEDQHTQTHKPIKIDFLFKPKTNLLYKSKFRIAIEDSIYYDVVVRGKGSFEEELQVK